MVSLFCLLSPMIPCTVVILAHHCAPKYSPHVIYNTLPCTVAGIFNHRARYVIKKMEVDTSILLFSLIFLCVFGDEVRIIEIVNLHCLAYVCQSLGCLSTGHL